jgi:cell division protein FtsX
LVACSAGAGAVSWLLQRILEPQFPWMSLLGALVQGAAVSLVFAGVFLVLSRMTRIASWRQLASLMPFGK